MKKSPLVILFITLFIDLLGFGIVIPLIPVYIQNFGGKPWIGGVLLSSYSIMQFIFSPIWGRASDRYGRRPVILIGLIGSAVSFFFFGIANSLAMLFISRVAGGMLTAASLPTCQAYVADVTPPQKRASGMAIIGAAFGLGFAFGPWIGAYLGGRYGHAAPALFAAALSLINFCLALAFLPESHTDRSETISERGIRDILPAIARSFQNPSVRAAMLVFAFATFSFTAVESSFSWLTLLRFKNDMMAIAMHANGHASLALVTRPEFNKVAASVNGRVFGTVGFTILLTQLAVMGGLARKAGEHNLVRIGALVLVITLIGIAFANSILVLQIFSAFIAIGNGVMGPSLNALVTHAAGPSERGAVSGTQQSLGSLARIIAPPINNKIIEFNSALPFVCSAVLMLIAFVLSFRLRAIPHHHDVPPTVETASRNGASHAADSTPAEKSEAIPE